MPNILYKTLQQLKIGSVIKVTLPKATELYIVNDKKNFCKLEIVEHGIIMNTEWSLNHFYAYLNSKGVKNIEQFMGEELSRIKTLLLEILFCISKYETNDIYEKDVIDKVNKLKNLLY